MLIARNPWIIVGKYLLRRKLMQFTWCQTNTRASYTLKVTFGIRRKSQRKNVKEVRFKSVRGWGIKDVW